MDPSDIATLWIMAALTNIFASECNLQTHMPAQFSRSNVGLLTSLCMLAITSVPMILHLFAILQSSWISNRYCEVGLFWTSCRETSDEEYIGFGWSVTLLVLASTIVLLYGCLFLIRSFQSTNIDEDHIVFLGCLLATGVLDILSCSFISPNCRYDCIRGASYHFLWFAGWIMVLPIVIPFAVIYYVSQLKNSKEIGQSQEPNE